MILFLITICRRLDKSKESQKLGAQRIKTKHDELNERLLDIERDDAALNENNDEFESLLSPTNQSTNEIKKLKASSKLFSWAISEWRLLSIGTLALFIASICSLAQPYFFGKIITAATIDGKEEIIKLSITLLVIFIFGGAATLLRSWLFTLGITDLHQYYLLLLSKLTVIKVGERIVRKIRKELFSSIIMQGTN
jgi:ABC-type bacteriocin/lantibiotic exporter with double-glycine peptidase domain